MQFANVEEHALQASPVLESVYPDAQLVQVLFVCEQAKQFAIARAQAVQVPAVCGVYPLAHCVQVEPLVQYKQFVIVVEHSVQEDELAA